MSETDNPYEAAIRWDCPYCFAPAGTWCHVKGVPWKRTLYLHARREAPIRRMLREEFFRGVAYERSCAELRALRAAQQAGAA